MNNKQINILLSNIRAIKKANIIIDGISVIAGENGCGKSTIAKLAYNCFKTSIDFNEIINEKLKSKKDDIQRSLLPIFMEILSLLKTEQEQIFKDYKQHIENNNINAVIDYLIEKCSSIEISDHKQNKRINRIKSILRDILITENVKINLDENITVILEKFKTVLKQHDKKATELKISRPLSILDETLNNAFYDAPISNNFSIYEFGVPAIDREQKKLMPIYSIQQVAYIDTPMALGVDNIAKKPHWADINTIAKQQNNRSANGIINNIFKHDILKGDTEVDGESSSGDIFVYKRKDGKVFDLLECATGLKSFSMLQILYKNGFLNNKTLLIIDEPEVHLHPQWVVEYARLVVLLNKHLGVKILLASHHPDMISAIKYISEKEKTAEKTHFYLAEANGDFTYTYKNLGTDIEDIFESFNIALERIDQYGATD